MDVTFFSDCEYPLNITNGMIVYTNTTFNATVTFTCDIGYRLIGNDTNTCDESGTWNGTIPECQIVGMYSYYHLLYHTL